ncbi:MAG: SDR family oxidoreductase [Saprospiraceae bacterium]|nr:SDR family oxidoreductase [Saprospiraceae bacterium]
MHTKQLFDLTNKIAVVTGGSGLYGKSISLALAESGATVIIASRNVERCKAFAMKLVDAGMKADAFQLDQGEEDSIQEFVRNVESKYAQIDILVNNSVTRDGMADLDMVTKEGWERAQKVNSTGLVLLTQAVIKGMVDRKQGNIINIGSIQGVAGPRFPVYGDTGMSSPVNYTYDKWGMVGFTKWIANKYGKFNIRCNCISPGGYGPGVDEMIGRNEFYDNYTKLTPLGRFANDDDMKGPIAFLASDASSYVTGHNLLLDGGWSSW